ncbi:hypothetical protein Tco_1094645 [Tanacetum coccineum]|uniref:SCP domain-containing protein n=1 Tax=Tanacetum coccineum TaxID=301880 RepID=A0ABQ5IIG5_9ASTR
MFFYLTTLGLARFLKETVPQVEPPAEGQSSNAQAVQAVEAWKHSDFLCHNYVLNEDELVQRSTWKLGFLDYKMVDSKERDKSGSSLCRLGRIQKTSKRSHSSKGERMRGFEDIWSNSSSVRYAGGTNKLARNDTYTPDVGQGKLWLRVIAGYAEMPKRVNQRHANMVDENVWTLNAMVSDCVADKSNALHSCRAVDNGQKLYMCNSATADYQG